MRIVDLHCYPGTKEWIACQGPYVEALAKYWKREWVAKPEDEVVKEFEAAGVEACLVALDLETTIKTKPVGNDYVHAMWKRHPKRIIQCWGALEPFKKDVFEEARKAISQYGFIGFHFHPIMQHFTVDDPRCRPLFEQLSSLRAAVMIDVGTTGMGAGMPGGQLLVRVSIERVFPNCPRYIHTMQEVARSPYVPHAGEEAPVPGWKKNVLFADALPVRANADE